MEKKGNKKTLIIASIVGAAVLLAVALAIIVPIANISGEFNALIQKMEEFESPRIVITDMSAENNFSGKVSEIDITDEKSVKVMIRDLAELADSLKYDSRDKSIGAWDVRFKVMGGEESAEIYIAEDKLYFVKNDVKYIFVPKDAKATQSHKNLYSRVSMFVA